MNIRRTSDVWWKNAVFYCLDVETFQDSNGDGIGDFAGLTQRLDYLAGLGVTCLWLMPFYPSPNRDDGYDIKDYYSVDSKLGSLGDFVEFLRTARDRGMRVIADLVVNHTSDEHPWFQASRSDRNSPFRDWYVWSDEIPHDGPEGLVFPGAEDSNWEWDEKAGQYFLHRFYRHQPDLNIANPEVRDEICKIVGFWLELGLSGFRVDAVPFLLETAGIGADMEVAPHDWMRQLRGFIGRRRGDAMLLGEVNLNYEDVRKFYGDEGGDELHMCLNFNLNQALALALVRADSGPLVHSLNAVPSLPDNAAWANFVRNHDEWSLDKLTEAERQEVFKAFGPKPEMQLFGRGLRRRLPTMLDGDEDRIRMTYALTMALPGAPVLFYGEEIGMAENLDIPGRMSVRAPMQWTSGKNGGFSSAEPEDLRRPVVGGRKWGPAAINVTAQDRDPQSLLNWMERLIRRRRECPEIAFGTLTVLPATEAAIVGLRYDWGPCSLIALHNLSEAAIDLELQLEPFEEGYELTEVFGAGDYRLTKRSALSARLERYGFRWIRIAQSGRTDPHRT
ncbi:MAG TPA: alpha-amylase family protein [Devosiaceae bacterium]|jgi:maltose alpha-D-glucosyltransferase/alpha-amylase|nr:alpha-amylase family protein [Devosiaceae bacterium]